MSVNIELQRRDFPDLGVCCFDFGSSHSAYGTASSIRQDIYRLEEVDWNLDPEKGLDLVVDIGGNTGLFSFFVAKKLPVSVQIFEPNSVMYRGIVGGALANDLILNNVCFHPYGVASETKVVELLVDPENSGGASLIRDEPNSFKARCMLVDFEKVLELYSHIKYLKIDIEGAEWEIFDKLIENNSRVFEKVDYLHMETHDLVDDYKDRQAKIIDYLDSFDNLHSWVLD